MQVPAVVTTVNLTDDTKGVVVVVLVVAGFESRELREGWRRLRVHSVSSGLGFGTERNKIIH